MLRNDSETRNGTQAPPFLRGTSDPHQVTLRMLTGKTRYIAERFSTNPSPFLFVSFFANPTTSEAPHNGCLQCSRSLFL